MTDRHRRVTRGFSVDGDDADKEAATPPPRRIRTREQIMKGEGKRPPAAIALAALAHNPFNPREELTDIDETAESLRVRGQLQPVAVVRRTAFLAVHPDQETTIGAAEYVVIDGNRRLAAAALAGLEELRIDVNDELAASTADIVESALIANIHRVDVAPLDQANAIQQLVEVHGSQGQVAKRLGKTPAWVSQRLALLGLTEDLQEKVTTGELKVEPARRIGRMPKAEQAAAAAETINAVKTPRQRTSAKPRPGPAGGKTVNAVNTPAADGASAVKTSASASNAPTSTPAAEFVVSGGSAQEIVDTLVTHLPPNLLASVTELLVRLTPAGAATD